ncbi:MAG: Fic family protein [Candidatus Delongbacteria bacterium]|nr:Fic family protein [Candidatus Delongbacteria bacterium]MCG2761312.1 Fic family protein [Candidatus Delongbacteria bacterium]
MKPHEAEFIHPFTDGNGRMGRLWQTVLLRSKYPVFEFLPIESAIKERQKEYYGALSRSDSIGKSTPFIEFMLKIIEIELDRILWNESKTMTAEDRLSEAKEKFNGKEFTRKEYLRLFKDISTATASRDLKYGVESGSLFKAGEKRLSKYKFNQ